MEMDVSVQQGKTQNINLSTREEQMQDCRVVALVMAKTKGIWISIGNDSQLEDPEQDLARQSEKRGFCGWKWVAIDKGKVSRRGAAEMELTRKEGKHRSC